MLKMQLLGHSSVVEEVKRLLREFGAVEVTDVSIDDAEPLFDEEKVREAERLRDMAESAAELVTESLVEEVSIDGMCGVY